MASILQYDFKFRNSYIFYHAGIPAIKTSRKYKMLTSKTKIDLPVNARQGRWHRHESLWISEPSPLAAVGVGQVDVVRLRLEHAVRCNHLKNLRAEIHQAITDSPVFW